MRNPGTGARRDREERTAGAVLLVFIITTYLCTISLRSRKTHERCIYTRAHKIIYFPRWPLPSFEGNNIMALHARLSLTLFVSSFIAQSRHSAEFVFRTRGIRRRPSADVSLVRQKSEQEKKKIRLKSLRFPR